MHRDLRLDLSLCRAQGGSSESTTAVLPCFVTRKLAMLTIGDKFPSFLVKGVVSREPGKCRHLSVGGHAAARDSPDDRIDALIAGHLTRRVKHPSRQAGAGTGMLRPDPGSGAS